MAERIPIGSDHAGFKLKERLKSELKRLGYEPVDVGTKSEESTDYPDYAKPVAEGISVGEVKRGVLMCGTGLGMSYTANRFPHVRAAVAWTPEIAELSRHHNDSNILVLPARFVSEEQGIEILKRWLETPYDGGRHDRRIEKIERTS
jgi:ribose 5-phosphate isomerase B